MFLALLVVNGRFFVNDVTTVSSIRINEDIDEILKSSFRNTVFKDDKAPGFERNWVCAKELLATEIPSTSSTRVELRTSKLDIRRWNEQSLGLKSKLERK